MGDVSKEMAELLEQAQVALLEAIPGQAANYPDRVLSLANAWAILQEKKPRVPPPAKSVNR